MIGLSAILLACWYFSSRGVDGPGEGPKFTPSISAQEQTTEIPLPPPIPQRQTSSGEPGTKYDEVSKTPEVWRDKHYKYVAQNHLDDQGNLAVREIETYRRDYGSLLRRERIFYSLNDDGELEVEKQIDEEFFLYGTQANRRTKIFDENSISDVTTEYLDENGDVTMVMSYSNFTDTGGSSEELVACDGYTPKFMIQCEEMWERMIDYDRSKAE